MALREQKMKAGHTVIVVVIALAILGTFLATNTIRGNYASITGNVVAAPQKITGLQTAVGSVLFGLVSIVTLVVLAKIGQNTVTEIRENRVPGIRDNVKKAEAAIEEGNHVAAYALYNTIRDQYAQLKNEEKIRHRQRIMRIHHALTTQAAVVEAHYLTDKYVKGTINQEEFERLKQIVISQ